MLKVAVKVTDNRLSQMGSQMQVNASMIVRKTTFDIERMAKESMQGAKGGRVYPRTGGNYHQASAPGEAPAIDTGTLVNSIHSEFQGLMTGIVFTGIEYAPYLEYGTSKMAARPFFTPAAESARAAFVAAMMTIIRG